MVIMNSCGKKIQVWCTDCHNFVVPVYNKAQDMTNYDEYLCPNCGRLVALVEK